MTRVGFSRDAVLEALDAGTYDHQCSTFWLLQRNGGVLANNESTVDDGADFTSPPSAAANRAQRRVSVGALPSDSNPVNRGVSAPFDASPVQAPEPKARSRLHERRSTDGDDREGVRRSSNAVSVERTKMFASTQGVSSLPMPKKRHSQLTPPPPPSGSLRNIGRAFVLSCSSALFSPDPLYFILASMSTPVPARPSSAVARSSTHPAAVSRPSSPDDDMWRTMGKREDITAPTPTPTPLDQGAVGRRFSHKKPRL